MDTPFYYFTVMSFHQIRSTERVKYKTVIHCSVLVSPVCSKANTDKDISLAFCVVYIIRMCYTNRVYFAKYPCILFVKPSNKIYK